MNMFGDSSNLPPGVSGSDPNLTGEWPCPADCEAGQDDDGTSCGVCEGKGYVTGEETYMDDVFVCSECDGDVVVDQDFADTFICKSCDTRYEITSIGNGTLVKK